MQILLVGMGLVAFGLTGFLWMILASPYSRRCWAVWLLTTADSMEAKRSAIREIDDEQRRREDSMRVSYGVSPIAPFRQEKTLVKRG